MSRRTSTDIKDVENVDTGLEDFGHRVVFGASCLLIARRGFIYREQRPPAGLRNAIACTWSSSAVTRAGHHLRIVPDGCTELVYSADRGLLVHGPSLDWSDVELEPHARSWGIRLMPAAASTVLRMNMTELGGRVVPAADIMKPQNWDQSAVREWLPSALRVIAERTSARPPDPVAATVAAILADRPSESLSCVAEELGVSERHLRRQFARATGLAPASYRRIARMKSAVAQAWTTESSWATIAHDAGFSDQSHLVRELRALTGMTPNELCARRVRPTGASGQRRPRVG